MRSTEDEKIFKNWGKQLDTIIKSIVSPISEPTFSRLMYDLFFPLINGIKGNQGNSLFNLEMDNMVRTTHGFQDIIIEYPEFDDEKYVNYFASILKRLEDYFFEDETLSESIRLSSACYVKHLILNEIRVNPNLQLKDGRERLDQLDKQIRRFNKGQDIEDEKLPEYFSDILTNFSGLNSDSENQYLFDKAKIEKINQNLRGEYIDVDSPDLLPLFISGKWKLQQPQIDWKGPKHVLIYLIYILNNKNERLPTGEKIWELIEAIFTVKNKKLVAGNLRRQFSATRSGFHEGKTHLPSYAAIDILLK